MIDPGDEDPPEPLPITRYPTMDLAIERARLYLTDWSSTKPWRDYLDAAYAVVCEDPGWGQSDKWVPFVEKCRQLSVGNGSSKP